ncbi:helix-turn-helix domain-containing protein [Alkalibacterium sp. MB6]|uniref:helix-turn-helix domain-containing protein n=1 Tax=Alkalibacterium sp. MB6 TaxID=2081965 RepID=UPI00192A4BA2|nr:helix-turn-helix domain-containing protein [Alkalibacterium sp. MB6]
MSNELGEYLRQLRGKNSLREIAERSNGKLSHNVISTAEKGVGTHGNSYIPSPEKLKAFSEVYGVSYSRLMSLAGYAEDTPEWASEDDVIELEKMLDENANMSFGGESLTPEQKQRVQDILTTLFWEELQKQKKGGADE